LEGFINLKDAGANEV